jgi:hypothetical protein
MAALLVGSLLVVLLAFVAVRSRRACVFGGAAALVDCAGMLCSVLVLAGLLAWGFAGLSWQTNQLRTAFEFSLPEAHTTVAADYEASRAL